jgi:hypothetical protein
VSIKGIAMGDFVAPLIPWPIIMLETINFLLALGMIALLLAIIIKYLPALVLPEVMYAWVRQWRQYFWRRARR